ncbi:MAG: malto-oligosyltrehalose trehalohydrolase [Dehalococcoidia bacterium]|nr:malto-oligosyltrehalose trehalohydrolase [Dehalococcoidia bacterium]
MKKYVKPGALLHDDGTCEFIVWAPYCKRVDIHITTPAERSVKLSRRPNGYFSGRLENIREGPLYYVSLDDKLDRPDPASRFQPSGVHGPSQIISSVFSWSDQRWQGLPVEQYIFYEIHTGTFSREGTFAAIIKRLDYLKKLGITAIELMPVAQFPGSRNWGYDGVYPYAVQNSYGRPAELKELVNACHCSGLAVVLDVVYNHIGPEGNYLRDFGPYFTKQYGTPWGEAINFDGPNSDGVRHYFIQNALYWISDFHIDALRLDAVHAVFDQSPVNIIEELTSAVHNLGRKLERKVHVFAESNANDARLVRPHRTGGYGVDAVWNDDFHHALHTVLTRERNGYYSDYGNKHKLKKALTDGFVYTGQYAPFWKRSRGSPSSRLSPGKFVVFSQNHDQIGNRICGERLSKLATLDKLKLAAAMVLLSPYLPLLFMGEEYGEESPFLYFVDHSDQKLLEAVRKGRRAEFSSFHGKDEPSDPAVRSTFTKSTLDMSVIRKKGHRELLDYYRRLIFLRRHSPALYHLSRHHMQVSYSAKDLLQINRSMGDTRVVQYYNLGKDRIPLDLKTNEAVWHLLIDSADRRWLGKGSLVEISSSGKVQNAVVQPASIIMLSNQAAV